MARPTKPKDVKPKAIEGEVAAKEGGGGESKLDIKFIITVVLILASMAVSAVSTYFLAPMVVVPQVVEQLKGSSKEEGHGEHGAEGGGHAAGPNQTLGMNLELDEFTVNLKPDPSASGSPFLRTKISLSIAVPEAEYCDSAPKEEHAFRGPDPAVEMALRAKTSATETPAGTIAGAAAPVTNEGPAVQGRETSPRKTPSSALLASGGGGGADPYEACQQAFNKNMSRYVPIMRDIINQALMKRTAGTLKTIEGQEILKDEIKEQINLLMDDQYSVIRVNFSDFIIHVQR